LRGIFKREDEQQEDAVIGLAGPVLFSHQLHLFVGEEP
jgi:hypothetical protein